MERSEVANRLSNIIGKALNQENFIVKDELTAKDVEGWTSLSHMIIISEIEKQFQVKFKLKELNKIDNIGNLIDLIQTKTATN